MTQDLRLQLKDLGCSKGGRPLFSGVNLSLNAGQWLHLKGPNGSGKTSLLRLIAGLTEPDQGQIEWREKNISSSRAEYAEQRLYFGHYNGLQESSTVLENLQYLCALHGQAVSVAQIHAVLVQLGLRATANKMVRYLSQGQKRRVAMARLWLSQASLWVLDEPFVALDYASIGQLIEKMQTHLAAGGCMVLTSHQEINMQQPSPIILEIGQ